MLPALPMDNVQVSQLAKTGSGIGGLKEQEEEHLPMKQTKHDDGHEEQKEIQEGKEKRKQQMSVSTNKDKDTDQGKGETLTLTPKLSKLSLRKSYQKLKEVPGKVKRSRAASLFHKSEGRRAHRRPGVGGAETNFCLTL